MRKLLSDVSTGVLSGLSGLAWASVGCGVSCLGVGIGGAFGLGVEGERSDLGCGVESEVSCRGGVYCLGVVWCNVPGLGCSVECGMSC